MPSSETQKSQGACDSHLMQQYFFGSFSADAAYGAMFCYEYIPRKC